MPFPKDITYPTVATNAAWQKKKSVLDKGNKTNVGPKLTAAEADWKLIKFNDLKDDKNPTTSAKAKTILDDATEANKQVVATRASLKEAIDVATAQSKSKKLNKASTTALTAIVVALKAADKRLADMYDLVGNMQIDLRNVTQEENDRQQKAAARAIEAQKKLSDLVIKLGSQIIATADDAKLATKSYEVTGVTWQIDIDARLKNLQKTVSVTAKDEDGKPFAKDMKFAGVTGQDQMRLK